MAKGCACASRPPAPRQRPTSPDSTLTPSPPPLCPLTGATARSKRKTTGCWIQVAELGEADEQLGEGHNLKASRNSGNGTLQIHVSAKGGIFGEPKFRLCVADSVSGATSDTMDNILNLPFFIVKRRDGRRFRCKFTAIIAMAANA